ncbi:YDG domain-containing protein [Pseudoxanthomonas broegbernensis]|uniref:YDG domain-containing protein n=1 Tax=Pseudoxanthomonas broegbernensis TaxID=83619 RepID=UPI001391AF3F|nr:YDG domain-containing protein [Pseudoxanthomonas broegbernensis]MBB6065212.1 filamentous hemagglutinin family protein [Pseudoxanthomonas broegbernensis]
MNHTYRLIWDEVRGAYVVVAEIASSRGKRASAAVLAAAMLVVAPLCAHAQNAGTLPTDGRVVAGQAQLDQHGSRLTVRQGSQRLIMNWAGFDIGGDAGVRFEQPNSGAIALNRVLGNAPSLIAGELSANGQVWLVNPNGAVFGKGAQVDVGGLVVSSLSISDEDFLAGRARFAATGAAGAVRNEGSLRAGDGVVALLAPSVANTGQISAGQVGLGAGDRVALDFAADGLLSLQVERAALEAELSHSGLIQGNNVILSASSASALRSSVINLDGVVEATGLSERGGRIVLDGGEVGEVRVGGRLDASSQGAGGGRIEVLGQHLVLDDNTRLDASGASGGGDIHVGGGWQGNAPALRNATSVEVAAGAVAKANATGTGQGGEVVFWSDDSMRFAGNIEVRGGEQGGDGGRAEVSGKRTLSYSGRTDARATHGRTGDLLLDPAAVTIRGGGSGSGAVDGSLVFERDLEAQNANVLLQATESITFEDLNNNGGDGRLSMGNNISLRVEVTPPSGDNGNRTITFANSSNVIEVFGTGSIYMQAGSNRTGALVNVANLIAHGAGSNPGTLPSHTVTTVGSGTPAAGSITLYGADGITLGGAIATNGGYVRIWADSDNAGGGGMTVGNPISTGGGNLYISAGNSSNQIDLNSNMTLGTGRLFFHQDGTQSAASVTLNGLLSASGNVDITTPFTFGGNASIHTDGAINFGNVAVNLNTGAGVLTLRANSINWGTATLNNLSTASMRLEPYAASTNMVLGAASGFASAATLNKLPGIRNLTIGREDGTGTISVSGNYNFNASGSFEVVNRTLDFTAGGLSNTTGNVILTGDNINIGQAVTANGGTGKVVIRQATAANELRLGSGLDNASIGQVNAATLEVGRSDGGDLVFDSDISTSAGSVHLKSGGRVVGVDGGVSASNLAITAGGGAEITDDTFDFTTLALNTGGNSKITSSAPNWGLGTVDGLNGLSIQTGRNVDVTLNAQGTLGLNSAIAFANTASTLYALAGSGFSTGSATLSGQSQATVEFGLEGAGRSFELGGSGSTLSGAGMARFNGVKTLRVAAADDDVTVGAFSVNVGDRVEIVADHLAQQGAMAVGSTGSLYLDVAQGGLQLDHAIGTNTGIVSLHDRAGAGIRGSGVITTPGLALRSAGGVALSGVQQVNQLAAEVGSLSLRNGRSLAVGTVDGLSGVDATDVVDLRLQGATSDLVLGQAVHAGNSSGADTAVLLAAGRNFINNAGASAITTDDGRWLVQSTSPLADTRGGLASDFKQYDASSAGTVLGSDNGFLYTVAPQLTLALTGSVSKTYDGNTAASVDPATQVSVSGAIDGDTVVLDIAGPSTYADKNVGTGKAVSVAGITLDGASNGTVQVYGYGMAASSASGNIGTITAKQIQLAAGVVQDKTYDGTTAATLRALNLDGVVTGDNVSAGGTVTAQFADRNAGTNKQVNLTGLTLGGTDAGNYQVSNITQASIARKMLQAIVHVDDKVYDGNTGAHVSSQALDAVVTGDDVVLDITGSTFSDKNVGIKVVALNGGLVGTDAGNYELRPGTMSAVASITPKTIGEGTLSVASKVYDGTRDAQVGTSGLVGAVAGDDLDLGLQGLFADKNAGTGKAVNVQLALNGADAGNYRLAHNSVRTSGDITQKTLDAGALDVVTKVYDGTRDVQISSATPSGVVAGDNLLVDVRGQFDDKNAGTGKAVDVQLALRGTDAGNYRLTHDAVRTVGDIVPRTVDAGQLTVATKVYDGTRDAQVGSSGLGDVVSGDDLTLGLQGLFVDKNAGTGKTVDVQLALGGADAANYRLASGHAQATGDIVPKTVVATGGWDVAPKVYDGSRDAQVSGGTIDGVVSGDDLDLELEGQFNDKNAGTGKAVDVRLSLGGTDAGNYQLAESSARATGDVSPRDVEAGPVGVADKAFDGTRNAGLILPPLQGLVDGDQVLLRGQGLFDDSTPAADKTVWIDLSLGGADGGNYRLLDARQQATAAISNPPNLNAVDALSSPPPGGNGTQSGMDNGGGGLGAATAAANAQAGMAGSAQPQLPPSAFDAPGSIGAGGAGQAGAGQAGAGASGAGTGAAGTGTSGTGAAGSGSAGTATAGADAAGSGATQGPDTQHRDGTGTGSSTLVMEQVLRNGDGLSVSLGGEPLAEPQVSVLPVFLEEQGQFVGQFRVDDTGDSLALHPLQGSSVAAPRLDQPVRASYEVQVQLDDEQVVWLRLELLEDGTLRIVAPQAASQLGQDVLGAYGLSALKRLGNVAPQQVRMLVLRFEN